MVILLDAAAAMYLTCYTFYAHEHVHNAYTSNLHSRDRSVYNLKTKLENKTD